MNRFERWAVWATSAVTALTGFGYFWTKYLLRTDDPWAVVNHPLEPWFLRVHVVAAPLMVFAIGTISVRHVWKHFRNRIRSGRRSGIATALLAAPMVLTGYLIQVITGEALLRAMAISHIAFGVLYVLALLGHQLFLLKRPRARPPARAGRRWTRDAIGDPAVAARLTPEAEARLGPP